MTRLTILGCGGSMGVPLWGNQWGNCDPANPKNNRLRTSAMVDYQGKRFLIDTAPDLRHQVMTHTIGAVDAVLYTHIHADHVAGIDELRALHWLTKKKVPIYGSQETLDDIEKRFPYLVHGSDGGGKTGDLYKSYMTFQAIKPGPNRIEDLDVTAIELDHITCKSFGYRFGNLAYTTDLKTMSEESLELLQGITHWIVSCPFMSNHAHVTHAGFPQIMEWIDRLKPQKTWLTHLGHSTDYEGLLKQCPPNVEPCYDGLVIESR